MCNLCEINIYDKEAVETRRQWRHGGSGDKEAVETRRQWRHGGVGGKSERIFARERINGPKC